MCVCACVFMCACFNVKVKHNHLFVLFSFFLFYYYYSGIGPLRPYGVDFADFAITDGVNAKKKKKKWHGTISKTNTDGLLKRPWP